MVSPDLERPAAPGAGLGIVALDHVGIATSDLEAAVRFHVEVLGLELVHRELNDRQGVVEAMLAPRGSVDGVGQTQLLAATRSDSAIARFLERSGPGLQHVAYRVSDLDVACAQLRSRGTRLLYDRGEVGTRGSRINFVHPKDAGGVLVELVEVSGAPGTARSASEVADTSAGAGRTAGGEQELARRNVT